MRRILLLSILLITGNLAAQDVSKSFVNKDFQDERYTYFKLSADSFSTDFELKYFRELVFKSPILVIVDAHSSADLQVYKSASHYSWEEIISEARRLKKQAAQSDKVLGTDQKNQLTTKEGEKE